MLWRSLTGTKGWRWPGPSSTWHRVIIITVPAHFKIICFGCSIFWHASKRLRGYLNISCAISLTNIFSWNRGHVQYICSSPSESVESVVWWVSIWNLRVAFPRGVWRVWHGRGRDPLVSPQRVPAVWHGRLHRSPGAAEHGDGVSRTTLLQPHHNIPAMSRNDCVVMSLNKC